MCVSHVRRRVLLRPPPPGGQMWPFSRPHELLFGTADLLAHLTIRPFLPIIAPFPIALGARLQREKGGGPLKVRKQKRRRVGQRARRFLRGILWCFFLSSFPPPQVGVREHPQRRERPSRPLLPHDDAVGAVRRPRHHAHSRKQVRRKNIYILPV